MDEEHQTTQEEKIKRIGEDFYTQFSFDRDGFSKPIIWNDGAGISLTKKFPNSYASLYKIGISNGEWSKETEKKKILVSIGYGKETQGGISLGSESSLYRPIDLEFREEFTYDSRSKKFYYQGGEISPVELIAKVQNVHELPTKKVFGLYLRCRLWFWRRLLPSIIRCGDLLLVKLLWFISGEKVEPDIMNRLLGLRSEMAGEGFRSKPVEFKKGGVINFFGYEAKRWSVIFYCGLHLFAYSACIFWKFNCVWFVTLFTNSFLLLCYVVVSFSLTEISAPFLLKSIIGKITPKLFGNVSFKSLRIKA